jgi:formamidopyrimidine-DNA glycosylase
MPELPEVETVRRTLERLVRGKSIAEVEVLLPRIIRRPAEPEAFTRALVGQSIQRIERRGKFLQFILDDMILISHLRMEGRYGLFTPIDHVEKHTHVIFRFTDQTELRYKDVRQFGTMDLWRFDEVEQSSPLAKLGVEPLSEAFTFKTFVTRFQGRTTKIKPLLLNQEIITGLGNIYVDEVLHQARIHPEQTADTLSRQAWRRLYEAIRDILGKAVDAGGSSVKSYVDGQGEQGTFQAQLHVYGRQGQACVRCGAVILKMVVGGRGTHLCPSCQSVRRRKPF